MQRHREGPRPVVSAWITLCDSFLPLVFKNAGFERITIDLQHGSASEHQAFDMIARAIAARLDVFVRLPTDGFSLASRMLDMGAHGVIAPMINSADDARRLVKATKYNPVGERSWGPHRTIALNGTTAPQYFKSANSQSACLAMIETEDALENLEAILSVPGLDGVFIGPADLSIALSKGEFCDPVHPTVDSAIKDIIEKVRARDKLAGIYAHGPDRARELGTLGFQFVALASDVGMMTQGAAMALQSATRGDDG